MVVYKINTGRPRKAVVHLSRLESAALSFLPNSPLRVPVGVFLFRICGLCVTGRGVQVIRGPTGLTHIPLIEVGDLRGEVGSAPPDLVLSWGQGLVYWSRHSRVSQSGGRPWRGLAVYLHVLSQGARMRVRLVAASDFTVIRLVAGVHMRMLLPVAAVGELPVATIKFALKWFLPYRK